MQQEAGLIVGIRLRLSVHIVCDTALESAVVKRDEQLLKVWGGTPDAVRLRVDARLRPGARRHEGEEEAFR